MLFSLIGSAVAYSLCDTNNYPFANNKTVVQWVRGPTSTLTVNTTTTAVTVTGSVGFQLLNTSFTGPTSAFVYGGIKGSNVGIKLSRTSIRGNLTTVTLGFVTDAGAWVSYSDFNQFRLYDEATQILIATADLPLLPGVPTAPAASATSMTVVQATAAVVAPVYPAADIPTDTSSTPSSTPSTSAGQVTVVQNTIFSLAGIFALMVLM
ncbi:hypothetical protein EDD86DRAFT_243723 [Gorgonomyces haynaldii]|nr:hypothetical protein EDD86DRAFT_243723 [Gorgonomyces haynaldii]